VFERFRQADASTTRAQAGLGLGLALVRSLTELHGGTVTARSDGKGKGATFTVSLPVRAVFGAGGHAGYASAKGAEGRDIAAAGCLDGLHVVAIDDQEEARVLVQAVLEQYGARVTACSTAEQVVAAVVRDCPDLLLADIGMPGCDGYELIRRIRALGNRRAEALPAVALTAYGGAHDRMQALAAGFCEHLAKPIMPEALVRVVAGAAGRAVLP
jgi:CheY-like chemotaxis protein